MAYTTSPHLTTRPTNTTIGDTAPHLPPPSPPRPLRPPRPPPKNAPEAMNPKSFTSTLTITLCFTALVLLTILHLLATSLYSHRRRLPDHLRPYYDPLQAWPPFQKPNTSTAHPPRHPRCIMYDKPPRTASTTILSALRRCWMSTGYKFYRGSPKADNNTYIRNVLRHPSPPIAIGGIHFSILDDDVRLIARHCATLFYVTSTRSMRERIASRAKYEASGGRVWKDTQLTEEQMRKAVKKAMAKSWETERRLESYPFKERHIPPDYVIRTEKLTHDLKNLLHAFRCPTRFKSTNRHTFAGEHAATQDVIQSAADGDHSLSTEGEVNSEDRGDFALDMAEDDGTADDDDVPQWEVGDLMPGLEKEIDTAVDEVLSESEISSKWDDIPLRMGDKRHKRLLAHASKFNERGLRKASRFVLRN